VLIYLAGPLFSNAERRFNVELTRRLEAIGFEVFLPQHDGVERDRPPYDTMAPRSGGAMFELDRTKTLGEQTPAAISHRASPGESWRCLAQHHDCLSSYCIRKPVT